MSSDQTNWTILVKNAWSNFDITYESVLVQNNIDMYQKYLFDNIDMIINHITKTRWIYYEIDISCDNIVNLKNIMDNINICLCHYTDNIIQGEIEIKSQIVEVSELVKTILNDIKSYDVNTYNKVDTLMKFIIDKILDFNMCFNQYITLNLKHQIKPNYDDIINKIVLSILVITAEAQNTIIIIRNYANIAFSFAKKLESDKALEYAKKSRDAINNIPCDKVYNILQFIKSIKTVVDDKHEVIEEAYETLRKANRIAYFMSDRAYSIAMRVIKIKHIVDNANYIEKLKKLT